MPWRSPVMVKRAVAALLLLAGLVGADARAQEPGAPVPMSGPAPAGAAVTLTYANRPIVELRAQVLSRLPAERAAAAVRALDALVARDVTAPVSTRAIPGGVLLVVGGETVLGIVADDVDALAGEAVERHAEAAAGRLQAALAEVAELRQPGRLLRAVLVSLAVTAALVLLLWLLRRLDRLAGRRFARLTERRLRRPSSGLGLLAAPMVHLLHRVIRLLLAAAAVTLVYLWLANVLRRFPYTRPWGESLRELIFSQFMVLGGALVDAAPGLLAVAIILLAARWTVKAVALLFDAVERKRLSLPGVYPDTAVPTRRLVTAGVWMVSLAMAYPYVPGSGTEGFKGIGVFVGIVLSLGSSGVVQHLLSGLMLTYARALHVGDFARIGEVEGTVIQIGAVATKVRTAIGEEVTIPNAVVVSQTLTNYSTGGGQEASYLTTSVTIGYDTPWRQVEALLLAAARGTPGLRTVPPPKVRRVSLDDYYVKYTLLAAPADPCGRADVLDGLHTRILDAFNEHGVQIMSPHYVTDPASPKLVAPGAWSAHAVAPAAHAREVSARS